MTVEAVSRGGGGGGGGHQQQENITNFQCETSSITDAQVKCNASVLKCKVIVQTDVSGQRAAAYV